MTWTGKAVGKTIPFTTASKKKNLEVIITKQVKKKTSKILRKDTEEDLRRWKEGPVNGSVGLMK